MHIANQACLGGLAFLKAIGVLIRYPGSRPKQWSHEKCKALSRLIRRLWISSRLFRSKIEYPWTSVTSPSKRLGQTTKLLVVGSCWQRRFMDLHRLSCMDTNEYPWIHSLLDITQIQVSKLRSKQITNCRPEIFKSLCSAHVNRYP